MIEHVINTVDNPLISVRSYQKDFLRNELDSMLEQGLIEECESPWRFPVVLAPKKDGQFRVCVDYRSLDQITTNVSYELVQRLMDPFKSGLGNRTVAYLDELWWFLAVIVNIYKTYVRYLNVYACLNCERVTESLYLLVIQ